MVSLAFLIRIVEPHIVDAAAKPTISPSAGFTPARKFEEDEAQEAFLETV